MTDRKDHLTEICLGLGSNLGDRLLALKEAKKALLPYVEISAVSGVYEMPPAYIPDQPLFLNAALRGKTTLEPRALLYTVRDLEMELGRQPTFRYGPRRIDIDILFYDELHINTPELTIPHAKMIERHFVLRPLADIAPGWVHPVLGKTVQALWEELPALDTLHKVEESF